MRQVSPPHPAHFSTCAQHTNEILPSLPQTSPSVTDSLSACADRATSAAHAHRGFVAHTASLWVETRSRPVLTPAGVFKHHPGIATQPSPHTSVHTSGKPGPKSMGTPILPLLHYTENVRRPLPSLWPNFAHAHTENAVSPLNAGQGDPEQRG